MTSLMIHLPDDLAKRVEKAGILDSEQFRQAIERILNQQEQKHERFKSFTPSDKNAVVVTAEQIQKILDEEGAF